MSEYARVRANGMYCVQTAVTTRQTHPLLLNVYYALTLVALRCCIVRV